MNRARLFAFLVLIPMAPWAGADTVYRCVQNGKTIFSDTPVAGSCVPLEIKVPQADPAELARLEEKKRQEAERDRREREQAEQERAIRAQEASARAMARLAEAQRQLAEQRAREAQPPPAWTYPWLYYPHALRPPHYYPHPPFWHRPPPTPGPPGGGVDRISPRGPAR
ncbi:hypothetical protein [Candidatus Methylocalor cossyra]|uniref:DUF4124 domain-containing protein n=1 Tax=Candidatus Methylocalor cossyra TaxID=3108543 RepID=A0ABM9NI13_9GAMM